MDLNNYIDIITVGKSKFWDIFLEFFEIRSMRQGPCHAYLDACYAHLCLLVSELFSRHHLLNINLKHMCLR